MSKPLLPLCSIPKLATRDGYGGASARLLLPFYEYAYWFASGQQYTFPNATVAQVRGMNALSGTIKPDTYQKTPGICLNG